MVTAQIHASLNQRDLVLGVHLANMGYIDAELLVESERRYQLDLLGPVRGDYRRQGQEDKGFAAADVAPSFERLQSLAVLYRTSAAALVAERDEAMPLFALLDQASAEEIAQLIRLVNDTRDT